MWFKRNINNLWVPFRPISFAFKILTSAASERSREKKNRCVPEASSAEQGTVTRRAASVRVAVWIRRSFVACSTRGRGSREISERKIGRSSSTEVRG